MVKRWLECRNGRMVEYGGQGTFRFNLLTLDIVIRVVLVVEDVINGISRVPSIYTR